MTKEELKEYLKENLKLEIEVDHVLTSKMKVNLKLDGEVITSDLIFLEELEN